jgi:hypothetical protein
MFEKEIKLKYSIFWCFITQDFLCDTLADVRVVTSYFDPVYHTSVALSVLGWAAGVEIYTLVLSKPVFLCDSKTVLSPPTHSVRFSKINFNVNLPTPSSMTFPHKNYFYILV